MGNVTLKFVLVLLNSRRMLKRLKATGSVLPQNRSENIRGRDHRLAKKFSEIMYIGIPPPSKARLFCPRLNFWLRPQRRDGFGVYVPMTFTVIFLDVLEICCFFDPGYVPVHILQPPVQAWVSVAYTPEHELEMLLVYCVKSHQRRVQLDVYLCRLCCAKYEGRGGGGVCHHLLEPIQRFEDDSAILLVVLLGVCEAGFVDAGVEVRHHPTVHFINLSSQLRGVGIKRSFLVGFRQIVVKCVVQHTHNILTLIVHNLVCFFIPQHRHRVLTLILRV